MEGERTNYLKNNMERILEIEEQDLENDVISRENCEENSNHGKEKMVNQARSIGKQVKKKR